VQRVPHLDGLRGAAILLVLVGHLVTGIGPYPRAAFGDLGTLFTGADSAGVQLFFALSGYLITSLLLKERDSSGSIDLRRFWFRRLRRLYPPLIVLCAGYLIAMVAFPWTRGEAWTGRSWAGLGDIGLALTYTGNVAWLWVPRSGWLGHTWSLAVEEQFYLIWPLVILAVLTWWNRRGLIALIGIGSAAMVVAREVVPDSVIDTGVRWDGLLLGALVGLWGRRAPRWVTLAALVAFGTLCVFELGNVNAFYTGTALGSAVLVAGAHHLGWLRSRVLVHLGHISYSLYLWHVFVLRFAPPWWTAIPLSLAAAEASYRLVERRFMTNPPPLRSRSIDLRDRSRTERRRTARQ
jgi:peptidoglycan/LPS O-acetylase OafA/YrhL